MIFLLLKLMVASIIMTNDNPLSAYQWENRILIISASTANDPDYTKQMEIFENDPASLNERDLILFKVFKNKAIGPKNQQLGKDQLDFLKEEYKLKGVDFKLLLIGKDGTLKKTYLSSTPMKSINQVIDAMPMRKAEMRRNSQ